MKNCNIGQRLRGLVRLGLDAPSGASLFLSVNLNSAEEISIHFCMQGRKQRLSSFGVDAHAGRAVSPVVCVNASTDVRYLHASFGRMICVSRDRRNTITGIQTCCGRFIVRPR